MKMGAVEKFFVNSSIHSHRVARHAEKMLHMVDFKAGQRFLDVGCGNGQAALYLAGEYQLDVTGVDIDPDQIRVAEESSQGTRNARFLVVDGTELPFDDGEFDIVATHKVTHHIPDWEDALTEMVRVLRPNGYFMYNDLVYPAWLVPIGKALMRNRGGFPTVGALEAFVARNHLSKMHLSKSWVHFETVCQRPAAG